MFGNLLETMKVAKECLVNKSECEKVSDSETVLNFWYKNFCPCHNLKPSKLPTALMSTELSLIPLSLDELFQR